jgi:hypothetical protein
MRPTAPYSLPLLQLKHLYMDCFARKQSIHTYILGICFLSCLIHPQTGLGQETIGRQTPEMPPTQPPIAVEPYHTILRTSETTIDTLQIPFYDDFSRPIDHPYKRQQLLDTTKWHDQTRVRWNASAAIQAVDFGTVMFDGCGPNGLGYITDPTNIRTDIGDSLMSMYIDLRQSSCNCEPRDAPVFLSFFYQAGGKADYPEDFSDTLFVEMRDTTGKFVRIFPTEREPIVFDSLRFTQAVIQIQRPELYHANAQLRFSSLGTQNGFYDVWLLDKVYLGKFPISGNGIDYDTVFRDRSISHVQRSPFYPYSAMPKGQFRAFMQDSLNVLDGSQINTHNLFSSSDSTRLTAFINDPLNEIDLLSISRKSIEMPAQLPLVVELDSIDRRGFVYDSTNKEIAQHYFLNSTFWDAYPHNDTLTSVCPVDSLYAYDDGEAETWYGVKTANKGFGQLFTLHEPGNVEALWIAFSPRHQFYEQPDSFLQFKIVIWQYNLDTIIKRSIFLKDTFFLQQTIRPVYTSVGIDTGSYGRLANTFFRFPLDSIVRLNKGQYIFGMTQVVADPIGIGFDLSQNLPNYIYYQSEDNWFQTKFDGVMMLRPELTSRAFRQGDNSQPFSASLAPFVVYPNPASNGQWAIQSPDASDSIHEMTLEVMDMLGRIVYQQHVQQPHFPLHIDMSAQQLDGIYIVRLSTSGTTDEVKRNSTHKLWFTKP